MIRWQHNVCPVPSQCSGDRAEPGVQVLRHPGSRSGKLVVTSAGELGSCCSTVMEDHGEHAIVMATADGRCLPGTGVVPVPLQGDPSLMDHAVWVSGHDLHEPSGVHIFSHPVPVHRGADHRGADSEEYLAHAGSSTKQGTYMGLPGFLFLLPHTFEDGGLLLATTIFPALGRNHI